MEIRRLILLLSTNEEVDHACQYRETFERLKRGMAVARLGLLIGPMVNRYLPSRYSDTKTHSKNDCDDESESDDN